MMFTLSETTVQVAQTDILNVSTDSEADQNGPIENGVPTSDSQETGTEQSNTSSYTTKQILTLLTLCALNTSSAMFYSLLAPFFPTEV